MGDRVSISFKNKDEESVALFNHWGGMEFVEEATAYAKDLKQRKKGEQSMPLDRLEVGTVMVDFIRHVTRDTKEVQSSLYLGKDLRDGDNSDNGHHVIDLVAI